MNGSDSAQLRTWIAVVRAYQACEQQYARALGAIGLSIAQFDALSTIDALDGMATPSDLAQRMLVTRGNVSGLLSRLRQRGWVNCAPHPTDARSQHCELSTSGRRVLHQAQTIASVFISEQMRPFDADTLARTEHAMNQMRLHLESMNLQPLLAHAGVSTTRLASATPAADPELPESSDPNKEHPADAHR